MHEYYLPLVPKNIARKLLETGADVFGFSACTWNSAEIISIAEALKQSKPGCRIITGGPQASAAAGIFQDTGLFDTIVVGEGEGCIVDVLLNQKSGSSILTAAAADFSAGSSPYPAVLGKSHNYEGILWEVSRGCPYSCSFCYESRGCKEIRTISEERMKMELELFRKNQIKKIWVLDPTFNHSSSHAVTVLNKIHDLYPEAHYTFEIRAELMNKQICLLLSELDTSLQIGLQTTNTQALEKINRRLNPDKFLNKCRMMSGLGLSFGIDLIYGLPGDNYESFKESLDFAVAAAPNNLDIFPLSVLPGTELAEKTEEYGIKHSGFPSYITEYCKSFSMEDMTRAEKLTNAVDSLYNREQAFTWFNTAAAALKIKPSLLFEQFSIQKSSEAVQFIKTEFTRRNRTEFLPVIESLINWSRAAEAAFSNPGRTFTAVLCRRPEVLDELTGTDPETFLRRHPTGKDRTYRITFDGEELYIN
jgi:radical SAM superfamily enzyme YgiQ (UPF0313 family)